MSRTQVLNPKLVDLNAVLGQTARMLRPLIGEDIDFRMDLVPGLGPVNVDTDKIVQVVLNMVVNARDAMPRSGELVIETRNAQLDGAGRAEAASPAVLLSVRDTGSGMDFTTKGEKGTGLGLSTVYGIVEQSGGRIHVESQLVLPVEDDAAARRALEEFLTEDGYTVFSAGTGDEAEHLFRIGDPIDVVVTDTVMPRMSGPELVERLRAWQPGVKVIFMSGHTPETVLQHGGIGAGTAFLQKPFDVEDLLSLVRNLLAERPRPLARGAAGFVAAQPEARTIHGAGTVQVSAT